MPNARLPLNPEKLQAIVYRVESRLHGHIIYPNRPLVDSQTCFFCETSLHESYLSPSGLRICEHCLSRAQMTNDGEHEWIYAYGKAVKL